MTQTQKAQKILFFGTEDGAFCQHRLPMARALKGAGFEILVCAKEGFHKERIEQEGFTFIPWRVRRGSINPFVELVALVDMIRIIRREKPDIIFNVALKPILYGAISTVLVRAKHIINLFAGLGAVFIEPTLPLRILRKFIFPVLRMLLSRPHHWIVVQNRDNLETLKALGFGAPDRFALIPGSGVDLDAFALSPEPDTIDPIIVTMVGRMLWHKGVREMVEAARILKHDGENIRIVLVGAPDEQNPASVPRETLEGYNKEGIVDWQGQRSDIVEVWKNAHIALLPSYAEGTPKSLLEAAAMGRPLIAFDAVGSRDVVKTNETGILVPFGDVHALTEAIKTLAHDRDLRLRLGKGAREAVETTYSSQKIGESLVRFVKKITTEQNQDKFSF